MNATLIASVVDRYLRSIDPATRRSIYLPPGVRGTNPNVDPEGTDLAIWTWESGDRLLGIAFQANQSKPLWHYQFRNEAEQTRTIAKTIANRKRLIDFKQQRRQERRQYQHDVKVGDIFTSSWGYDQTQVQAYEVVKTDEKSIVVREIATKTVRSDPPTDYVVPLPGRFVGAPMRVVPGPNGVTIAKHYATKWDGRSTLYETTTGWGH